jgi:hypothetical protein
LAAAPGAAPAKTGQPAERNVAGASFIRGSGEGRYVFEVQPGLVLGAAQDIGPIDVKAYDYMRSLLIKVETTTAGAGTVTSVGAADFPFNIISYLRVKQPNGQTMYSVSNGYHAAMIQKYGLYRESQNSDPRSDPEFLAPSSSAAATAPTYQFAIRIPFELDLRDALGSLPNKDAAAPFTIELGLNSTSTIYTTPPATAPTIKITPILEAYDQPPETLDGKPVETTPPNMNTLQRWTEQSVTMVSGAFDARVRKLGNYVRELLFLSKNSSGARIATALPSTGAVANVNPVQTGWSDPMQIVLDEDVKDNLPSWLWLRDIWETWGFGGLTGGSTTFPANNTAGGYDDGVWPYQYCINRRDSNVEEVAKYLPTIESEDYLLRGQSWGTAVSKLTILKCEVLPRGDIFGDA